jgi:16S rRNA (guanine527-N7)-methyltransferase
VPKKCKGDFDFIVSRAVTNMPDFVSWVKPKSRKNNKHVKKRNPLPKGGDLTEELKDFPKATEYNLAAFFEDEFFETKKVVRTIEVYNLVISLKS